MTTATQHEPTRGDSHAPALLLHPSHLPHSYSSAPPVCPSSHVPYPSTNACCQPPVRALRRHRLNASRGDRFADTHVTCFYSRPRAARSRRGSSIFSFSSAAWPRRPPSTGTDARLPRLQPPSPPTLLALVPRCPCSDGLSLQRGRLAHQLSRDSRPITRKTAGKAASQQRPQAI